jgi:hypothetical protein
VAGGFGQPNIYRLHGFVLDPWMSITEGREAGRRFKFLIFLSREGSRRRVDSHRNRDEKRLCLLLGGELSDVNSVGSRA